MLTSAEGEQHSGERTLVIRAPTVVIPMKTGIKIKVLDRIALPPQVHNFKSTRPTDHLPRSRYTNAYSNDRCALQQRYNKKMLEQTNKPNVLHSVFSCYA
jgi:hypothetical protein